MKARLVLPLLGLAMLGCKSVETTKLTAAQAVAPAPGTHMVSGNGYTFYLPETWVESNGSVLDPDVLFKLSRPSSGFGMSEAKPVPNDMTLVDSSVKVMPTDAPVMLNVIHKNEPGGISLKDEAERIETDYFQYLKFVTTDLTLPIGPAKQIVCTRASMTGDKFYFAVVLIANDKDLYIMRFIGNDKERIAKTATECALTFRLDPAATKKVPQPKIEPIPGLDGGSTPNN